MVCPFETKKCGGCVCAKSESAYHATGPYLTILRDIRFEWSLPILSHASSRPTELIVSRDASDS